MGRAHIGGEHAGLVRGGPERLRDSGVVTVPGCRPTTMAPGRVRATSIASVRRIWFRRPWRRDSCTSPPAGYRRSNRPVRKGPRTRPVPRGEQRHEMLGASAGPIAFTANRVAMAAGSSALSAFSGKRAGPCNCPLATMTRSAGCPSSPTCAAAARTEASSVSRCGRPRRRRGEGRRSAIGRTPSGAPPRPGVRHEGPPIPPEDPITTALPIRPPPGRPCRTGAAGRAPRV